MKSFIKSIELNKQLVLKIVLLNSLQIISIVPVAWIIKSIFDVHILEKNWSTTALLCVLLSGLFTLSASAQVLNRKVILNFIQKRIIRYRHDVMHALLHSSKSDIQKQNLHTVYLTITVYIRKIEDSLISMLGIVVPGTINGAVILVLMCFISLPLTLFTVSLSLIFILLNFFVRSEFMRRYEQNNRDYDALSDYTKDSVYDLDWIWFSATEQQSLAGFNRLNERTAHSSCRKNIFESINSVSNMQAANIIAVIILVFGGILLTKNHDTLGGIMGFFILVNLLKNYMIAASKNINSIIEGSSSFNYISRLLQLESRTENLTKISRQSLLPISIKNLTFGFDSTPLFKDLNMEIPQTGIMLIRGNNGEGKTTLLNLISGLYSPHAGEILFNGHAAHTFSQKSILDQLSFCMQEPVIVAGSILHNIRYFQTDIDPDYIQFLCEKLFFTDILNRFPERFDSIISQRGEQLSGGEKQRLSLIRTLAKPAELYIFDEPSNHLDNKTVENFIAIIQEMDKPVLVISHDPRFLAIANTHFRLGKEEFQFT